MPLKLVPETPTKQPSKFETAIRTPIVSGVGGLAALPGSAGDLAKGLNQFIAAPLSKAITGKEPVPYEQSFFGKILPTTEQHIKTLEENIPYLKPRNKVEKFSQDVVKNAVQLFTPGRYLKAGRYALDPLRSLSISLASNVGGEATKQFTGDERKGELVKTGTMLGLSFWNPTSAKNITQNLYQNAAKVLPQNATENATGFLNKLNNLENRITGGRPAGNLAPSEQFVIDEINKFRKLVDNGQINISQLTKQKRSFNEELQNNLFNIPQREVRARSKQLATQINQAAKETMQQYGKRNPEWYKFQSEADKAHGAISQSNFISRKLEKYMKGRPEVLAHIFGIGIPAGIGFVSPLGAIGSFAAYQSAKLLTRISKSPELAKHYSKIAGAAVSDNPKIINKELDELESKIEKEEKKKKAKYKLLP